MEDDLKKNENGRGPKKKLKLEWQPQKNGRRPQQKIEDNPKKMEDNLKKWKTT
jgi:hypothetical protein